ncbi:unnamed protein product, partial [Symbiodinium necroappetens]
FAMVYSTSAAPMIGVTSGMQASETCPLSASETTLPSASDPMAGGTDSTQARETPVAPADDPMTEATHDGMQASETTLPSASDPMAGGTDSTQARETPAVPRRQPLGSVNVSRWRIIFWPLLTLLKSSSFELCKLQDLQILFTGYPALEPRL